VISPCIRVLLIPCDRYPNHSSLFSLLRCLFLAFQVLRLVPMVEGLWPVAFLKFIPLMRPSVFYRDEVVVRSSAAEEVRGSVYGPVR
jgi:hypothetical protein